MTTELSPDAADDLSEASLFAEARARAGTSHDHGAFADGDLRDGLRALLAMYTTTARLTARGRRSTRRRLVELLANRLRIADTFHRHPEIRDRPVRHPVYLTGLPRTGTSALFNLLAVDPHHRPLLLWEARHPTPPEHTIPGEPDPRMVALAAMLDRAREANPGFARIHDARADGPEECVELLAHTLGSVQLGIEPLLSPYREWFEARDQRPAYAYYADLLRLLDWQRPGARWLLKSPCHLWALDVLLATFPDASIVVTHRDPVAVVGSYCSMIEALMAVRDGADPLDLGPAVLEYLARSAERAIAARNSLDPTRFLDLSYPDLVADPITAVERIYDTFSLPLSGTTVDAMREHQRNHPQNRHGRHDYALARYGLDERVVRARFAAYSDHFASSIA
jgi:hypothetical protein